MKSSFTFDGKILRLRLDVEDDTERAMARLMERLTVADVSVLHEQYSGYGTESIKAVSIHMRAPEVSSDG